MTPQGGNRRGGFARDYRCVGGLLALLAGGLTPLALDASDWIVTPGLVTGATYSDNIRLAPTGQEQGSFVAEVTPRLSIRRSGPRLNLGFDYNLQGLYRTEDDQADIFNQFAGDARAELLPEWLFLDFVTTYTQQNILATDLGGDNIASRGERTDVWTYAVSPFLAHRFGTLAAAEARLSFSGVDNSETFDTTADNIDLQFLGGSDFQRTPWRVFYERQKNTPSEGEGSTFQRTGVQLGYQLTSQFGVFSILGYEENDFASVRPESERDGFSWAAGANWTPSRRTRLEGGYSERPFGGTFFLDVSRAERRATWRASYREDFSTTTQAQLEQQAALITDSVTGQAETVPVPPPSLVTEDVFLSRRFEGSLGYLWRRTTASLALFAEDRRFETTGDDQRVHGGALAASRTLFRNHILGLQGEMQRIRDSATDVDSTLWRGAVQISRAINRYVTGSVDYSYQQQRSDAAVDEYTENRITLGVSVTFEPRKF